MPDNWNVVNGDHKWVLLKYGSTTVAYLNKFEINDAARLARAMTKTLNERREWKSVLKTPKTLHYTYTDIEHLLLEACDFLPCESLSYVCREAWPKDIGSWCGSCVAHGLADALNRLHDRVSLEHKPSETRQNS